MMCSVKLIKPLLIVNRLASMACLRWRNSSGHNEVYGTDMDLSHFYCKRMVSFLDIGMMIRTNNRLLLLEGGGYLHRIWQKKRNWLADRIHTGGQYKTRLINWKTFTRRIGCTKRLQFPVPSRASKLYETWVSDWSLWQLDKKTKRMKAGSGSQNIFQV